MKFFTQLQSRTLLFSVALISLGFIPSTTQAAYEGPVCVLWLQTTVGSVVAAGESEVMLNKGDELKIYWFSANATKAEVESGRIVAVSGNAIKSPTTKTTYTYTFSKGSRNIKCSVVVYPVEATVTPSTLSNLSSKPTLSGIAKNTKTISFKVFKAGSKKPVYESDSVKVTDGKWKHTLSDSLSKGSHSLVLYGSDGLKLNTISTQVLTIGTVVSANTSAGTIVAQPIPLLVGGVAKKNQVVGVSYLQVLNVGLEPVTISGIRVKQTGTASTDTVLSLIATDDTELHKAQVGKIGMSPFKSGEALIPISIVIQPKKTSLFTLKATLAGDLSGAVDDTLKLVISGIDSPSSVKGTFPIKGVTWTMAQ